MDCEEFQGGGIGCGLIFGAILVFLQILKEITKNCSHARW
jgi:hypothetical protein